MTISISRRAWLAALCAAGMAAATQANTQADTLAPGALPQDVAYLGAPDTALESKIDALVKSLGPTKVGFAAVDLTNGRTAFLREGELFPMQSVYKFPIAIAYLKMVEQGTMGLNTMVTLTEADIAPGRTPMAKKLKEHPTKFTARQLIEHMLLNSDNTATDALLKLGGGPAAFQKVLNEIGGLEGLRIDRFERDLQPQAVGLKASPQYANPETLEAAIAAQSPQHRKQALEKYLRDARDAASPRAMASLYFKLMSGHVLELQHTRFVIELMSRTKTGADRLNAGMLPGWQLARRSGQSRTVQGITAAFNDTGLATHKSGNKIIIVVFIKGATQPLPELAAFQRKAATTVLETWGANAVAAK